MFNFNKILEFIGYLFTPIAYILLQMIISIVIILDNILPISLNENDKKYLDMLNDKFKNGDSFNDQDIDSLEGQIWLTKTVMFSGGFSNMVAKFAKMYNFDKFDDLYKNLVEQKKDKTKLVGFKQYLKNRKGLYFSKFFRGDEIVNLTFFELSGLVTLKNVKFEDKNTMLAKYDFLDVYDYTRKIDNDKHLIKAELRTFFGLKMYMYNIVIKNQ